MAVKSEGGCSLCNQRCGKTAMSRHLLQCAASHSTGTGTAVPRVLIAAEGGPYWLHVDASVKATLDDLDAFLRKIWLECCGHMSQFTIGNTPYDRVENDDFGLGAPSGSMNTKLAAVFTRPGLTARYEYDMGSTTELKLRLVGIFEGRERAGRVRLLARNEPPMWPCDRCGTPATNICPHCADERDGALLCDTHVESHGCEGPEGMLPVVNSPRMGVCGYTG